MGMGVTEAWLNYCSMALLLYNKRSHHMGQGGEGALFNDGLISMKLNLPD